MIGLGRVRPCRRRSVSCHLIASRSHEMPGFRLTLLGGFRLEDEDGKEITIASRRLQGMLAVLALSSPAAVTRERIAAMFWGDLGDERARHSLRQLLSSLRRNARVIDASGDTLSLDTRVCKADAIEFQQLARSNKD